MSEMAKRRNGETAKRNSSLTRGVLSMNVHGRTDSRLDLKNTWYKKKIPKLVCEHRRLQHKQCSAWTTIIQYSMVVLQRNKVLLISYCTITIKSNTPEHCNSNSNITQSSSSPYSGKDSLSSSTTDTKISPSASAFNRVSFVFCTAPATPTTTTTTIYTASLYLCVPKHGLGVFHCVGIRREGSVLPSVQNKQFHRLAPPSRAAKNKPGGILVSASPTRP